MDEFKPMDGKSEFNSAINVMTRMNYWFYLAQEAQKDSNYVMWYKYLMNCYLDLADDMKKEQDESANRFINELNSMIASHNKGASRIAYTHDEHMKFIEFHKLLMKSFRDAGYKTKLKTDPYAAIR